MKRDQHSGVHSSVHSGVTVADDPSNRLALSEAAANALTEQLQTSSDPVRLTRQGHEIGVVLGVDAYERLRETAERALLTAAVREAKRDVAAGRVISHDEMKRRWLSADGES